MDRSRERVAPPPRRVVIDPDELLGRIGADAAIACEAAAKAAEEARTAQAEVARLHARDCALEQRMAAVEAKVDGLPALVSQALSKAVDEAVGSTLRKHSRWLVGVILGALGLGGGAGMLRLNQSDEANRARIESTKSEVDSAQKRLYEQALAEGIARRDRELDAARLQEARRSAAADRAANMRDPD